MKLTTYTASIKILIQSWRDILGRFNIFSCFCFPNSDTLQVGEFSLIDYIKKELKFVSLALGIYLPVPLSLPPPSRGLFDHRSPVAPSQLLNS